MAVYQDMGAQTDHDRHQPQAIGHGLPVEDMPASQNQPTLDTQVIENLHAAALSADASACTTALNAALDLDIRPEDIADLYIPHVARVMGDQWCADMMGFAGVTIGVSRLQAMLRDLGPDWSGDNAADPSAPAIMLIIGQDVYHTLGAMVLAGQLRRKGLSVRMMLGARHAEIAYRLQQARFEAVFISSSRGETLESLRQIVDTAQTATKTAPPIVIGGSILEVETNESIAALTGADYATISLDEALQFCGLRITPHAIAAQQIRN